MQDPNEKEIIAPHDDDWVLETGNSPEPGFAGQKDYDAEPDHPNASESES